MYVFRYLQLKFSANNYLQKALLVNSAHRCVIRSQYKSTCFLMISEVCWSTSVTKQHSEDQTERFWVNWWGIGFVMKQY